MHFDIITCNARMLPVAGPQPAPAAEEAAPLLQVSTKKEARLRGMHFRLGGKFEPPRHDEEEALKADLLPLASPALG